MDTNEIFRQVTLRICGNLDIQDALNTCFEYLKEVFPLTAVSLLVYHCEVNALEYLASVYPEETKPPDPMFFFSEQFREVLQNTLCPQHNVLILNQPELQSFWGEFAQKYGAPAHASRMVMRLELDEHWVGYLGIRATETACYTEEHVEFIKHLHDPFAIAMTNALQYRELRKLKEMLAEESRYFQEQILDLTGMDVIGERSGLKDVMTMVRQVAPRNVPVLLMGESGVGKEVIANVLHELSPRSTGPLIKVNCGAIPDTLIDSELFGHEKGAFTGATVQKRGRFKRAHHGTIFLDEIGELPLAAQVRLLRVLQEKEIERVGGTSTIPVDIRIIAATHRNLEKMVNVGAFRHDLWFRLNVFPITIPPLRERKQDIPTFVQYFIERKRMEMKLHSIPPLAPKAVSQLTAYDWPGNVRELHNVIERALIRNQDGPLNFDDLTGNPTKESATLPTPDTNPENLLTLDDMTSRYIRQVLHLTQGKINGPGGAAEVLDINPNTLRRRLDKLDIPYGRKEKQRF